MRRHHRLPFGAELDGRGVRFRLWAPSARQVSLCLGEEGARILPMQVQEGGWFALTTDAAGAGSRYRYRIDDRLLVPDPAARFQPLDAHGPSEVIDPSSYDWRDTEWRGRPWEEIVLYELHVGTFSARGDFAGVARHLDDLAGLGITAIELMPVADFPGRRNWGYDGVLLYAPDSHYGRPDDLKRLVDACHARGLCAFLDVVYNHFGPDGNYLPAYAPGFFTDRHKTPWGAAINFDGRDSRPVRDFYVHNALYWLEEYGFDGLRLDAVHAIADDSSPDIITEIAATVRHAIRGRPVHLVLENDKNEARYLVRDPHGRPELYTAQWNDDVHHALRVGTTRQIGGYYADYADRPAHGLGRALTEGFIYQGERSTYRGGAPRGEPSGHLPPTAFVAFIQNHDQVGNDAFGSRLATRATPQAIRAAAATYLLAPQIPMLFQGEEWGAVQPFAYFCDFASSELAEAVRTGRREEFAKFPEFANPETRARIPDPTAEETYRRSILDRSVRERSPHRDWLAFYRALIALRAREIVPRLAGIGSGGASARVQGDHALIVEWRLRDGSILSLTANYHDEPAELSGPIPEGAVLFATPTGADAAGAMLPPHAVVFRLRAARVR